MAVADQLAQSCEAQGIVRFRDPESEIASFRVFMCQVIDTAAILILAVQLRIVRQPVLYRAADDGRRVDAAVGFGDDVQEQMIIGKDIDLIRKLKQCKKHPKANHLLSGVNDILFWFCSVWRGQFDDTLVGETSALVAV